MDKEVTKELTAPEKSPLSKRRRSAGCCGMWESFDLTEDVQATLNLRRTPHPLMVA